jgi:hypothetical protein
LESAGARARIFLNKLNMIHLMFLGEIRKEVIKFDKKTPNVGLLYDLISIRQ